MVTRIGIRDLRNRTSEMIRVANREGTVIITEHGTPVAVLQPYVEEWRREAAQLLDAGDGAASTDSGLAALLSADDDASMDDM